MKYLLLLYIFLYSYALSKVHYRILQQNLMKQNSELSSFHQCTKTLKILFYIQLWRKSTPDAWNWKTSAYSLSQLFQNHNTSSYLVVQIVLRLLLDELNCAMLHHSFLTLLFPLLKCCVLQLTSSILLCLHQ